MKENNVNNKNVENCEIIYRPEGQMKKSVSDLLKKMSKIHLMQELKLILSIKDLHSLVKNK